MSEYVFKNMSDVDVLDAPTENTKVYVNENGETKQMLAGQLGDKGLIFEISESDFMQTNDADFAVTKNYDPLYEAIMEGRSVYIFTVDGYAPVLLARLYSTGLYVITRSEAFGSLVSSGSGTGAKLTFTNGSYHGAATTE